MVKSAKVQYCIKTCPCDNPQELENLLNEMAQQSWDLYSMHEMENDDEICFSCIFVKDIPLSTNEYDDDELSNITGFKTQMEKIMTSQNEPFEQCKDIQTKIQAKRKQIAQIKSLIDSTPESQRADLNDKISKNIKALDELKKKLRNIISPEIMLSKIGEEKLSISLSEEIIDLINPDLGANLLSETVKIRQELSEKLGYIIPKVVFKDDDDLQNFEFAINVHGVPAKKGFAYAGYKMFFKDELNLSKYPADSIKDVDILTGEKIVWIKDEDSKDFWVKGKTPSEYIADCLRFIAIKFVEDIFDYNDINNYVEIVGEQNIYLIENIIPDFLSVGEIKFILTGLIKEKVSIKDIMFIFEKLNDYSEEELKEDILQKIRISLARQISYDIADDNNVIQAFDFSDEHIEYFSKQSAKNKAVIRLDSSRIKKIVTSIKKNVKKYGDKIKDIVVLAPLELRYILFLVFSETIPNVRVISPEEVSPDFTLEILESI